MLPKKTYSRVQYFLWIISGSEISILKNCKTDYNRHSGIGLVILMTTIFAFFAGSYAGWYFSRHNIFGTITFGIIWSLLVFSIDRTMVTSLKKTPDKKRVWTIAVQLGMRVLLGALIAFIISIPVELLVFHDNIELGMQPYKTKAIIELNEANRKALNVGRDSLSGVQNEEEARKQDSLGKSEPTTTGYLDAVKNHKDAESDERDQKRIYDGIQNQVRLAKDKVPLDRNLEPNESSREYTFWKNAQKKLKPASKKLNDAKKNTALMKKTVEAEEHKWRLLHDSLEKKAITQASAIKQDLDSSNSRISSERKTLLALQKGTEDSFVIRFDVLGYLSAKDKTILMFLWLIRLLFFMIELLPSIVKLATPMGMYDYAIYNAEKDFVEVNLVQARRLRETSAQQRVDKELRERGRQMDERLRQKGILHDQLTSEALLYQGDIARKVLKEWHRLQDQKIKDAG